ncbi:serine hydrolase domain-containing protein [Actinokineospora bangkokensis]|uniref:Serine hydrolase n=1 Tax=Actinokineospora bangkokensis TaxID=1193682 RepID=A0A1Q9LCZ3_9PSEU|nr:serine hydrolase domain-containing protein [Actinokineospora bangkokensis]OLR89884.1 serine hydrolase [Actinokineospora bangkokensis]
MLQTTEHALLRRLATEQSTSRAPSLVAGVVRGDALVWHGERGRVDGAAPTTDTQYRIGSITKTFVAVLVMRLRDEGVLDLNDPLEAHVPGTSFGRATIAQLLSHTAGLTSESPGSWWERTPGADWDALNRSLTPDTTKLRPGSRFHYSNVGYGVLGEVVARHRGTDWYSALRAEVLDPLGMARTTPHPEGAAATGYAVHPHADVLLHEPTPDAGAMAPAGQLWSTVADLSTWARFVGGDTGGVLHPDTVAEMREPAHVEDADAWTTGYGLGLQTMRVGGRRLAGHGGSMPGFLAMVLADPATGTGALCFANSTSGVGIGALAVDLITTVEQLEPSLPAEWEPDPAADPALLALTGHWYWGPTPYVLRLLRDRWLELVPVSGRGRASRFEPAGTDEWVGLDGYYAGETLALRRDAAGDPSHLDLATFVFTRLPYGTPEAVPGGVEEGWRTT